MKKLFVVVTLTVLMSIVGIAQAITLINQIVAINNNAPSIVPFTISVSGPSSSSIGCPTGLTGNMGCLLLTQVAGTSGGSIS
jgi:hypothetical protein